MLGIVVTVIRLAATRLYTTPISCLTAVRTRTHAFPDPSTYDIGLAQNSSTYGPLRGYRGAAAATPLQ